MRPKVSVRTAPVPLAAEFLREIEDDGNGHHVKFASQSDERLARLRLDIGRIYDREPTRSQPLACYEMEDFEGFLRRGLVVLVIRYQTATVIGRQDLRGLEVQAGK